MARAPNTVQKVKVPDQSGKFEKTEFLQVMKNGVNTLVCFIGNPRDILDLLPSVINVSVQTVDNVKALPKVEFGGGE